MLKAVLSVAVGAVLGAGGMWFAVDDTGSSATEGAGPESRARTVARGGRTPGRDAVSVANRLAVYESAGEETDLATLERSLELAARAGRSPSVYLEIDALLMRISELAPARAAQLALGLEPRFVVDAYRNWARVEPAAALAALMGIPDSPTRRDVALGLLDVFGDRAGIERVAAALPEAERPAFTVDALAFRAASDPIGALFEALRLGDPAIRQQALRKVAGAWAAQDPLGALDHADLLPADVAPVFRTTVAQEWARLDGAALLSYLETARSPAQELIAAAAFATSADVDRLLALAGSMPDALAQQMKASAIAALAETNPNAALSRVNAMPQGPERERAISQAGFVLAMADSDAAVQWYRRQTSLSPDVVRSAATTMMMSDPAAALDLLDLLGEDGPQDGIEMTTTLLTMTSAATRNAEQAARIAERLIARNDAIGEAALDRFVSGWAERDPGSAADWARNLDQGEERDEALGRLLSSRAASTGQLDRDLLAGIGSEARRAQALRDAILALARKDQAAARVVLEREVADAAARATLERAIESLPNLPF